MIHDYDETVDGFERIEIESGEVTFSSYEKDSSGDFYQSSMFRVPLKEVLTALDKKEDEL